MKIHFADFVPKKFGNRKFIVKEVSDKIEVTSKKRTKYGKNPKPILLPKKIELDEKFVEAIGIYAGDGKMTPNDMMHTDLASKDADIIKSFLNLLKTLNVDTNKLYFEIIYRTGNKKYIISKWSKIICINSCRFKIRRSFRHRFDVLHIQLGSIIFRVVFEKMVFSLLPTIKNDKNLRRAFLRGYFAADGTIGFNEKENYLNYIGFSYDAGNESWLRDFCMEALKLEYIPSKFKEIGREGEITITGWNLYCKLWLIDLFGCCERKNIHFSKILRSRRIYCKLKDHFRSEFFKSIGMEQKEIAKYIKSWQGNVSKMIEGKHLLTIKQLKILQPYSKFNISDIIDNIQHIRFGPVGKGFIESRTEIRALLEF